MVASKPNSLVSGQKTRAGPENEANLRWRECSAPAEATRAPDGGQGRGRAEQSPFQAGGGRPEAGAGLPTAYSRQAESRRPQTKPILAEEASALIMDYGLLMTCDRRIPWRGCAKQSQFSQVRPHRQNPRGPDGRAPRARRHQTNPISPVVPEPAGGASGENALRRHYQRVKQSQFGAPRNRPCCASRRGRRPMMPDKPNAPNKANFGTRPPR